MEYTQGKLTFRNFSIYAADGKTPVADTCLNASVAAHDEANARRLVACWNACEGISTETLELVPRFTEAGVKTVQSVETEVAALKAQRDELLAGLHFYANPDRYRGANQRKEAGDKWTPPDAVYQQDVTRDGGDIARALIAKHKGASHG